MTADEEYMTLCIELAKKAAEKGECPVGAISAGASQYEIDGSACVDCGTCAGVCPTGAIAQG